MSTHGTLTTDDRSVEGGKRKTVDHRDAAWIYSRNPHAEVWRRIMELCNEDSALEAIIRLHGEPGKHRDNFRKQARHLHGALLQARDYFRAAEESTLATSPNHLYYGMASLATAMMLLHGDGRYALDALRQRATNRRHGFTFACGCNEIAAQKGAGLLAAGMVHLDDTGHFQNWSQVVPRAEPLVIRVMEVTGAATLTSVGNFSQAVVGPTARTQSILSTLQLLPDFAVDLRHLEPRSGASLMKVSVSRTTNDIVQDFIVQSTDQVDLFMDTFGIPASHSHCMDELHRGATGAIVKVTYPRTVRVPFRIPDIRGTIDHGYVGYAIPLTQPEFADAYRAAFGLSMLSRYYQDLWTASLRVRSQTAHLAERFVELYCEKAPRLALSYLCNRVVVVSSERFA